MSFKNIIKTNLLEFIKNRYVSHEIDFSDVIEHYKGIGEKAFYLDIERAIDSISSLSNFELIDIYENLRDFVPIKKGVLLCEKVFNRGNSYTLSSLEENRFKDSAPDDFIYEWAEETLQNEYYTDLLSYLVGYSDGVVDKHGYLTGLHFDACSTTYLLITEQYEFHPIRINEISIRFSSGNDLPLYRNVVFDDDIKPYDDLESFLAEIIDMEFKVPLVSESF